MVRKTDALDSFSKLEELKGILPTRPERSEHSIRAAERLTNDDFAGAGEAARNQLESMAIDAPTEDVTASFGADPEMRTQVAGFAAAGLNFFHSSPEFFGMSGPNLADRSGNPSVSRVFLRGRRPLLETSRIVVRSNVWRYDARRPLGISDP